MKTFHRLFITAFFLCSFCFTSQSQKNTEESSDYERGMDFLRSNKWDSAFLMLNRYVNTEDDILKKASAYNFIGLILWNMGDLYGAEQSLTYTIKTLDSTNEKHRENLGYGYYLLGNVNLDLKLYDNALNFYNDAIAFFRNSSFAFDILNGKATTLQKKRNYSDAISIYDSLLLLKPSDQEQVARIIDNRANTKWLQDPTYSALSEFKSALKIRIDSQYNRGLNASYAHLSDYYAKSKPDSAVWYAYKMYKTAKRNQSPADILEALDKLIVLNSSIVSKDTFYKEFKQLNDSLQFSKDTTRNRFALIRYDFQKSKADNLVLQQRVTTLIGLVAIAVLVITWLSVWYNKRKKKIKEDSENAIKDASLKTSQKVHDVVANGLYGIMNELEHGKTIDKEPLMTKIEGLYEKSRNISYEEVSQNIGADYDNQIHHLLTSFSNEQIKVIIVGNQQIFWSRVAQSQRQELQLVLNEIMVNMNKHSDAKNVVLVFKQENNKCFITYKDDGVGFNVNPQFGNGLNNTVSRIKSLNGDINFGKSEKGGVSIDISFPL